ncbi:MAG: ATP-dependent DNA helicase RecQ [Oceanospirillaceae bacterium]|nr:ATP-dependent DNA helicase RecQ [Oceanospirillaceae bacterium]
MESAEIKASLMHIFGFKHFRSGQLEAIQQLLAGKSTLAIFPTGSGKSLCYQFSATALPHLTLVVSPLLALMQDQLSFLASHNIKAASIDSTASADQTQQVMKDIRAGETKILMVSVERFKNERFRQFIANVPISMLVIDEAHCISEWGHNFRPDYLKLPSYQQQLKIPLVLLLTATATAAVKSDMAEKFNIDNSAIVQTGFYRSNLDLSVVGVTSGEKTSYLIALIKAQQSSARASGIVYVTLQKTAEQVALELARSGLNCSAYHAGLGDDKRKIIQHSFMNSTIDIVVATIAFGMGIDKADVRFVIHYDLPKSIENYSQEIGRAGRDGQQANCYTLANLDNINTLENFVYGDTPALSSIQYLIDDIKHSTENRQWEMQLYSLSLASNIRQLTLKTLLVQLELLGVLTAKYSYFAEFKIKFSSSESALLENFNPQRQVFLRQLFSHINFKRVWGTLNFAALYEQHNIERSKVIATLEYLAEKNLIELQTSQITEVFQVNDAQLQIPDLALRLSEYFNGKERKEIQRIQALVEFFERDSCLSFNLASYFDDRKVLEHGFEASQGTQNCGHCSACRGQVAKLEYSIVHPWPSTEQLHSYLQGFTATLQGQGISDVSQQLYCRFLAGITLPIFTKIKARKLAGFGSCDKQRYQQILERVADL